MRIVLGNVHVFVSRYPGGGWRVSEGQLLTDRRWCMDTTLLVPSMNLATTVFSTAQEAAEAFRTELLVAGLLVAAQDTQQDTHGGDSGLTV
jgi:hypothetical protein